MKDEDFIALINSLREYRESSLTNEDRFYEFVDLVRDHIQYSGWEAELKPIGKGRFLEICNNYHKFDKVKPKDRPEAAYHQLCHCLGHIVFDYIDYKKK